LHVGWLLLNLIFCCLFNNFVNYLDHWVSKITMMVNAE
jgi:hypothetical protein